VNPKPPVSEAMLSAYVDGRTTGRQERELVQMLSHHPAEAARAALWRRQAEGLRATFGGIAEEPLPLSVLLKVRAVAPDPSRSPVVTGMICVFLAGLVLGLVCGWCLAIASI